jgi:hypothetical protein
MVSIIACIYPSVLSLKSGGVIVIQPGVQVFFLDRQAKPGGNGRAIVATGVIAVKNWRITFFAIWLVFEDNPPTFLQLHYGIWR